jgi:GNAT superfamily N-acetyltransferase
MAPRKGLTRDAAAGVKSMNSIADPIVLSGLMKRLQIWLDRRCRDAGVIQKQFHGAPFGSIYVTIDARSREPQASFNLNRIYLCGTENGLADDGLQRLINLFTGSGVQRIFAWLSPGPDMDNARSLLATSGFVRNRWVSYPTLVHDGSAPAQSHTELDIREVSAEEVAAVRDRMGEVMWPDYARSAGRDGCFHYLAFDGSRPVAVAALYVFENLGYLAMASTAQHDRRRGAQQALIARRVARAREIGCAVVVSETLSILEGSLRNLQHAGFRVAYEKEVYEWNAVKPPMESPSDAGPTDR